MACLIDKLAHALAAIADAPDEVGVVAEDGSHAELLQKNGIYADLYRTQFDTGEKAAVS